MKRLIYIVCFSLFLVPFAGAQESCVLLAHVSLRDGVEELNIKNTFSDDGMLLEENRSEITRYGEVFSSKKIYEYNEKEFLIQTAHYRNDILQFIISNTYDDRGKLIGTVQHKDEGGESVSNRVLITNGVFEKQFYEENGTTTGKEITFKTSRGKIEKYQLFNSQGKVNHSKEYTYNNSDQEVYYKGIDVVGNVTKEKYTFYNSAGDLLSDSTLFNGELVGKTVYEYTNNNLSKKLSYSQNNSLDYIIEYDSDSKGLIIEERFIYNDEIISLFKRVYDASDNLIQEDRFNKNNELVRLKTWEYACFN